MMRGKLCSIFLVVFWALTAVAQEPSDRFYQAIRNNDLTSLRDLVKTSDVNSKDQRDALVALVARVGKQRRDLRRLVLHPLELVLQGLRLLHQR